MASTALLASALSAQAQQTWTGSTSTDWFTGTNWSNNSVPANGEQPTIDTTTPNPAVVDGAAAGGPATATLSQTFIGNSATGTLTIQNGGTLTTDNAFIGNNAGANGTVTVTGATSAWTSTNASNGTVVGYNGTGTFNVLAGGSVNTVNTILGLGAASSGTATVDGAGSTWTQTGAAPLSALFVGYGGTGSFTVQNGGGVSAVDTYVGHLAGSNGTATVTGTGSSWTDSGSIFIGNGGNGTFNVLNGGTLTSSNNVFLGYSAGSTGTLNVDGANSKFSLLNNSFFFVGDSGFGGAPAGTGIVNVTNGGELDMNGSVTGLGAFGGTGIMNFDNAKWNPGSAVAVGYFGGGTGIINIKNNSVVTLNGQIILGFSAGTTGTVTVDGSQFNSIALLDTVVGQGGTGTFTAQNAATASLLGGLVLGADAGSSGTVTVQNGSTFTTDRGDITIGKNGSGTFNVLGGSTFVGTVGTGPSANAFVGYAAGATGTLNVDGAGSSWSLPNGILYVGGNGFTGGTAGTGIVNVTNGATLAPSSTLLGSSGGTGTANIDGSIFNTGNLKVGDDGTGTLNITGGSVATISLGVVNLGECNCATGTVTVSGAGSQFNSTDPVSGDVTIGVDGTGIFNVKNGATANFATDVILGFGGSGSGTVNVESGGTFTTPGAMVVGFHGTGAVNVNGAGSVLNATDIYVGDDGTGTVNVTGGGAVNLSGTTFVGDCLCAVGTVTVSGAGSAWTSPNGADIGLFGTGTFNVLDGATANFGPILLGTGSGHGTLKIDATGQTNVTGGNYTQGANGTFNVGISPTGNGKLTVTGGDIDLTNGGTGNDGALVVNAKTTLAKQYTIMTATGGTVLGQFDPSKISVIGNASNLQVIYNPTSVVLTVDTFSLANLLPPGTPDNPRHVADALDRAIAGGVTIPDAFFNVFALSGDSLVQALSQLSGAGTAAAQDAAFTAGGLFSATMMQQGLAWMNGTLAGPGITVGGALGYNAAPQNKLADKPGYNAFAAMHPRDEALGRWRAWGLGFGGARSTDGQAGTADQSTRAAGGAFGVDHQIAPDLLVGFAAGGSGSSFSASSLSTSGHADAGHVGLYAIKTFGAAYLAATLNYARADNSTERTIAGAGATEIAKGHFASDQLGGRFEFGWKHFMPGYSITPFAAIEPAALWQHAYSEASTTATGAPGVLGLSYQSNTVTSLPVFLGAQFDTRTTLGDGRILSPYARLSWVHEFKPERSIQASFTSIPTTGFTVDGARAVSDAARIEAGGTLALNDKTALFANLNSEISSRSRSVSGVAGVRISW